MRFSNSSYHTSLPLAPPSPATSEACCSNVHSDIVQKLYIPPLYCRWTTMIFPVGLVPTCCRCDVICPRLPLLPLSPSHHSVAFRVWASWLVLLLSHILWMARLNCWCMIQKAPPFLSVLISGEIVSPSVSAAAAFAIRFSTFSNAVMYKLL